jgi:hypothetical protein
LNAKFSNFINGAVATSLWSTILLVPSVASAVDVYAAILPANHRLQRYSLSTDTVLWHSTAGTTNWPGSTCTFVRPVVADAKLFYQTVLAAKLAGQSIVIYFDPASCQINSFGIDG